MVVLFVKTEVGDEAKGEDEDETRAMAMEARIRFEGMGLDLGSSELFCASADGVAAGGDWEVLLLLLLAEDPETRMVDVMVPYTVLFLYTVSGCRVTVAVSLAVSNNTSVVCMPTHC